MPNKATDDVRPITNTALQTQAREIRLIAQKLEAFAHVRPDLYTDTFGRQLVLASLSTMQHTLNALVARFTTPTGA